MVTAAGIATVGAWVLGEKAGRNALTATIELGTPVVFGATGLAGPPTSLVKTAGDHQGGDVWSPVSIPPTVQVRDAYENPVAGVTVTFSVTSGGGEVQGATQTTDGSGMAHVWVWKLGPAAGPNTLEATVAGLLAATFTASAVDHCAAVAAYAFGATVSNILSSGGCRIWGEYTDRYSASASAATSVRLDMASSAFSSHVSLFDTTGAPVASSPYYCADYYCEGANSVRVLLGPGDYVVGAGGFTYDWGDEPIGGVSGPYSLSSSLVPEDVGGCRGDAPVFIVPGVTTEQRIETTDCADSLSFRGSHSAFFSDQIDVYLTVGRTYTISMSSAEFDTYLELRRLDVYGNPASEVAFDDDSGGSSDSRITFTPTVSGVYGIIAATHLFDTTGSYTLTVQ